MSSRAASGVPFPILCRLAGVAAPVAEYRFHATRRWRLDWAWPAHRVGLEIDGGGFVRGRHHRPAGYAADCVKLNHALLEGWRVLRCTPQQITDGTALELVRRALG